MRRTAKSNLLNEIEIKWYSLPTLMRNRDLGATVMDFMVILKSIDYSKLVRFSNVADEISTKILSSSLECEVLVEVLDQYDLKFWIKAVERKSRTEDSTHMQEIEIIGKTEKFQCHFKVTFEFEQ